MSGRTCKRHGVEQYVPAGEECPYCEPEDFDLQAASPGFGDAMGPPSPSMASLWQGSVVNTSKPPATLADIRAAMNDLWTWMGRRDAEQYVLLTHEEYAEVRKLDPSLPEPLPQPETGIILTDAARDVPQPESKMRSAYAAHLASLDRLRGRDAALDELPEGYSPGAAALHDAQFVAGKTAAQADAIKAWRAEHPNGHVYSLQVGDGDE